MLTAIIAFCAVFTALGLLFRILLSPVFTKIEHVQENLEGHIFDTDKKVDGLKTDFDGLKTDVNGLKTDFDGLKTDVNGLKTDVNRLEISIEQINAKMDKLLTVK